jgi:hypothetical protein
VFDSSSVWGKGFAISAFVVDKGALKVQGAPFGPLSAVSVLQAILKLSLVSQLSVAPENLTLSVHTVCSPLTSVQHLSITTKAVT